VDASFGVIHGVTLHVVFRKCLRDA
jgi:hypothetical protein